MKTQKTLAYTLKSVMAQRGISLTEFSEELGIARSSLQDYLKGEGNPRIDTLKLLADKLNIPVSQLIDSAPSVNEDDIHLGESTQELERILRSISNSYYNLSMDFLELAEAVDRYNKCREAADRDAKEDENAALDELEDNGAVKY